jgi:putative iron-only hydrogenase system regulator
LKTRVAVIGIIVEDPNSVSALNDLLHEYAPYIIGRMGIPYRAHHLNVISVAVDATDDMISALAGRLGALPGISAKTAYSNAYTDDEE